MERYSRMLLHFAHALTRRQRRVEAFLFSTELTRITMQLRARRITEAVSAVAKAVPDWSGGTRIGAAIRQFHQQWTTRSAAGPSCCSSRMAGTAAIRKSCARKWRVCSGAVIG